VAPEKPTLEARSLRSSLWRKELACLLVRGTLDVVENHSEMVLEVGASRSPMFLSRGLVYIDFVASDLCVLVTSKRLEGC
jgi:hypothetical protein